MFGRLFRNIKRLTILIPGIVVAYFSVRNIYPELDKWLPDGISILILYVLGAYILIPLAIRLLHLIVPPKHIPLYSTTPDGLASDPINVGVIGTRQELIDVMKAAGWYQADDRTIKNAIRFLAAMLLKQSYPQAPFSKLFLFGRSQDLGFELPVGGSPRHRHHIRFWGVTDMSDSEEYRQHAFFWLRHHRSPKKGKLLWVGAASLDTGIGIIRHTAQFTHMIHHDTNAERDFVINDLKKTGRVKKTRTIEVGAPYQLTNRAISGYLSADGKMKIAEL